MPFSTTAQPVSKTAPRTYYRSAMDYELPVRQNRPQNYDNERTYSITHTTRNSAKADGLLWCKYDIGDLLHIPVFYNDTPFVVAHVDKNNVYFASTKLFGLCRPDEIKDRLAEIEKGIPREITLLMSNILYGTRGDEKMGKLALLSVTNMGLSNAYMCRMDTGDSAVSFSGMIDNDPSMRCAMNKNWYGSYWLSTNGSTDYYGNSVNSRAFVNEYGAIEYESGNRIKGIRPMFKLELQSCQG